MSEKFDAEKRAAEYTADLAIRHYLAKIAREAHAAGAREKAEEIACDCERMALHVGEGNFAAGFADGLRQAARTLRERAAPPSPETREEPSAADLDRRLRRVEAMLLLRAEVKLPQPEEETREMRLEKALREIVDGKFRCLRDEADEYAVKNIARRALEIIRRHAAPPSPETREERLEKALREIADEYGPHKNCTGCIGCRARRALEEK